MKKTLNPLFKIACFILSLAFVACAFNEPDPQPLSQDGTAAFGHVSFNQNQQSLW